MVLISINLLIINLLIYKKVECCVKRPKKLSFLHCFWRKSFSSSIYKITPYPAACVVAGAGSPGSLHLHDIDGNLLKRGGWPGVHGKHRSPGNQRVKLLTGKLEGVYQDGTRILVEALQFAVPPSFPFCHPSLYLPCQGLLESESPPASTGQHSLICFCSCLPDHQHLSTAMLLGQSTTHSQKTLKCFQIKNSISSSRLPSSSMPVHTLLRCLKIITTYLLEQAF